MKHWTRPFLCLALATPLHTAAQQALPTAPLPTSGWRMTSLNFGTGVETDRFETMSLPQLMAFAKTSQELQRDLSQFDEKVTTTTSGLGLFVMAGFGRTKTVPTTTNTTSEVQVGVGLHTPREAMVTYRNQHMDTSIVYCNLQTEIGFGNGLLAAWTLEPLCALARGSRRQRRVDRGQQDDADRGSLFGGRRAPIATAGRRDEQTHLRREAGVLRASSFPPASSSG
ncbi:MAG: hypothetical protein IPG74_08870 [Flavobacteriales bacterium]|nr:hypothetical protein [Flavobacteriales bacterium]